MVGLRDGVAARQRAEDRVARHLVLHVGEDVGGIGQAAERCGAGCACAVFSAGACGTVVTCREPTTVTADSDTIERREPDVNISHVRVHVDSLHVDRAGPSAET